MPDCDGDCRARIPVAENWTSLMALATLLLFSTIESASAEASLNIGGCTNKDISIFQSPDGSSGIPRYAVQIMNNCMSDCAPSDIHVFCGWFASALLVNPNSFKRIAFDDCLVNGGRPLRRGETLRFTYANSFMYPLRFKSASFCK